ncbi:MAG: 1-acyl-sn-glycerol-3-phosphate acyltransferase [Corynebacterium sp.]|nr:1-acyl-sn-glycerol-3-phosphate acyltransferase [Corynebacterium sp.]
MDEPFYHFVNFVAKSVFRAQSVKFSISGTENIPETGGGVVVLNHTSYVDFMFGGVVPELRGRYLRFMAKAEIFNNPVAGAFLRAMKHIPVDRIDGSSSLTAAINELRDGELVGIFPESTISRSFEIKTIRSGAIRMAQAAGVPIIITVMFGTQRLWTKGHKPNLRTKAPIYISVLDPWYPVGDDIASLTAELRARMQAGLEQVRREYAINEGPFPAEFWVPASEGGTAPSLEQAQALDDAVDAERARIRALRDDLNGLAGELTAPAPPALRKELVELATAAAHKPDGSALTTGKSTITAAIARLKKAAAAVGPTPLDAEHTARLSAEVARIRATLRNPSAGAP